MPPKEKTPAEKAAERQRILDAALDIMATEGYASLTMRRLGQKIGASATKIYLYFVNKDQVYLSVIIEGYHKLQTHLQEAVAAQTTPEDQLEAFLRAYVEFAHSHPAYFHMFGQRIFVQLLADAFFTVFRISLISRDTEISCPFGRVIKQESAFTTFKLTPRLRVNHREPCSRRNKLFAFCHTTNYFMLSAQK